MLILNVLNLAGSEYPFPQSQLCPGMKPHSLQICHVSLLYLSGKEISHAVDLMLCLFLLRSFVRWQLQPWPCLFTNASRRFRASSRTTLCSSPASLTPKPTHRPKSSLHISIPPRSVTLIINWQLSRVMRRAFRHMLQTTGVHSCSFNLYQMPDC